MSELSALIKRAFLSQIKMAQEALDRAQGNFLDLCEARINESSLDSDFESGIAELMHAVKNFQGLEKKYKIFLQDPENYRKCVVCGEEIPLERHIEVPQTRHCVWCKNGR